MKSSDMMYKIEQNLLGRFTYIPKNAETMEVLDNNGLITINSHLSSDMFNIVCATTPIVKTDINAIVQYFQNAKVPFAWWFGFQDQNDDLSPMLEQSSFEKTEEELAMVVISEQLKKARSIDELVIYEVNSISKLNDYIEILTTLLPDEKEAIEIYYQQSAPLILKKDSPFKLMVGTYNNKLAATCSLYLHEDTAGIYDVITLPEFRGKGIAQAMTVYAAQQGFKHHAHYATLTATDDAKFVYEKIGFQALDMLFVYNLTK